MIAHRRRLTAIVSAVLGLAALSDAACFQTHTVDLPDGGAADRGAGSGGATATPGSGGAAVNPGTGGAIATPGSGGATATPGSGGAAVNPGTGGVVNVDPAAYVDAMLLSSCSGPRGEILDGAWWSSADAGSTIMPLAQDGTPFTMSAGGYMGNGAHVTGTTSSGGYAVFGLNMLTGSVLYNASSYAGFSFYAKSSKAMDIQVAVSQMDTDPQYGTCTALMSCYVYPTLSVAVGTTWARYVIPFGLMSSAPLPSGSRIFVSPSAIKHFHFSMPAGGAFDFWVDELYFVRAR